MDLVQIATEQTTALTDAVLGIVSFFFSVIIKTIFARSRFQQKIWFFFFLFLGLASMIGAFVHGVAISSDMRILLWHPLYLSLGLSVSFFVMGAVFELWGERRTKTVLPWMLSVAFLFFLFTVFIHDSFLIFTVYEGLCLFCCLVIFLLKMFQSKREVYLFMVLGILITILAAILQSRHDIFFNFIWKFDHNGVFHLVQFIGLIFIFSSVRKLLDSDNKRA